MNAKELLKENPELTHYFEVSDGEAFEKEKYAKAHAEHFSRKYEKVVLVSPEEVGEKKVQVNADGQLGTTGAIGTTGVQIDSGKNKNPIVVNTSNGPQKGSVVKAKEDKKTPDGEKEDDSKPSDDNSDDSKPSDDNGEDVAK